MDKLLIVMDPAYKHQKALARGIELARATGAHLEIVAFIHEHLGALPSDPKVQQRAKDTLIELRQRWLERMLALADCSDRQVTAHTVWEKNIHRWIIEHCHPNRFRAVIKTGSRSETLLYTPTDWHLIRECPVPVMLVAEQKWNHAHPVLAAVDLSSTKPVKKALNTKIIEQASALAKAFKTEIHLVHALHISEVLADLEIINVIEHEQKRREALEPAITHLCNTWNLSRNQIHMAVGPAHKVIPSVASKVKADMVVIGTSGKTGIRARVIGNTAEKVLTHLRTDLLAIKPGDAGQ
ncbi:MAG: universal stress protein [Marinobacter sp.]|uniref:universal stress protein n=1 Tax=Marinobacter sp. TaxID=50741 RepID=UPI001B4918A6|nr:universal stress protein [Marinobacter sp.]MBQ0745623.1 universal stress protein [Marinobacter sp.]MBQ0814560.1 universal stress protein [Marinobacter sp.]|tara:strand:- start:5503 stop:6390 length:888 start_codon:yes stop_codon:yes gene_type:complete